MRALRELKPPEGDRKLGIVTRYITLGRTVTLRRTSDGKFVKRSLCNSAGGAAALCATYRVHGSFGALWTVVVYFSLLLKIRFTECTAKIMGTQRSRIGIIMNNENKALSMYVSYQIRSWTMTNEAQ